MVLYVAKLAVIIPNDIAKAMDRWNLKTCVHMQSYVYICVSVGKIYPT
jgi:hypothetical protein